MTLTEGRPTIDPTRFDPDNPDNAAKFDAVERLVEVADDIGRTLPELALAFPVAHRAVSSVIIGPRTLDQLESALSAASIALDDETLDRIDAIVAPGTNIYSQGSWVPPWISDGALRRRPAGDRAVDDDVVDPGPGIRP